MKATQLELILTDFPRYIPLDIFSSRVDLTPLNNLKQCTQTWIIWVNSSFTKKNIIIKSVLSEVSVWMYWACGNRTHSSIFSRVTEAEYSSHLTTDSPCEPKQREIYGQMMQWCCHSPPENHEWAVKTRISIVCIQLKFEEIQNGCLTQTLVLLAGIEFKKNSCLKRVI